MRELGIETERFRQYFDQTLYPGLGLSRASFFDRDRFGRDRLVTGDPTDWLGVRRVRARCRRNGRPLEQFIADLSAVGRSPRTRTARAVHDGSASRVGTAQGERRRAREDSAIRAISYDQFLRKDWGLRRAFACAALQAAAPRLLRHALPTSGPWRSIAGLCRYPGFAGISLPPSPEAAGEMDEPYIHHFPDGNASIARLHRAQRWCPSAIPAVDVWTDIVLARASTTTSSTARSMRSASG